MWGRSSWGLPTASMTTEIGNDYLNPPKTDAGVRAWSARLADAVPVRDGAHDAESDDLVGQPAAPVAALGDAELRIEAQQVLLHGGLGDHQLVGDLPGGGRSDERLLVERRSAQRL